ncbi:MAG: hypothetical protein VX738_13610 [Planctomycetota bacterium]|nr:hypothetical protein [Planctomycetota bacterium]
MLRLHPGSWLALILSLLLTADGWAGPGDESALLTGLRERGLFEIAEYHCRNQLNRDDLTGRSRMQWTVELVRTIAQEALNLPTAERGPMWDRALKTAARFKISQGEHSLTVPVETQAALALARQGEFLSLEAVVAQDTEFQIQAAREKLRQAVRELSDLKKAVDRFLTTAKNEITSEELSQGELLSIKQKLDFYLGRVYRHQAETYPAGSDDRVAALQRAITALNQPLSQLAAEDSLVVEIQLGLIGCHTELEQWESAFRLMEGLQSKTLPPEISLRLQAQRVRWTIARDEIPQTRILLQQPRSVNGVTSPELDMARLDTYILLWEKAADKKDEPERKRWEQLTVVAVKAIEREHGDYWGRRAELRLLEQAGSRGAPSNLEVLERTADELYRKGNLTEAIGAYDQAADTALQAGADRTALQLSYKAALVVQKQGDTDQYINRLATLALRLRKEPTAPSVHMLAIRNVAALLDDDAQRQQQFRQLLEEHLQFFETGETLDQARVWLGALVQREGKWDEAIALYMKVTPTHRQFSEVLTQFEQCWLQKLKDTDAMLLVQQPHPLVPAMNYLRGLVTDSQGDVLTQWNVGNRQAVLTLTSFQLQLLNPPYEEISGLLERASAGDPEAVWVSAAHSLRIVALVAQGQREQAMMLIELLSDSEPQRWLEMLQRLHLIANSSPADVKSQIAEIQLEAVSQLQGKLGDVDAEFRLEWDLLHADARIRSGNPDSGYALYARVAGQNKKRGDVQQRYAEALAISSEAVHLREALVQWRRVLVGRRPRTHGWYAANFALAEIYVRLDEKDEARKRIQYLDATSGLGDPEWTEKFQSLLKRAQ